MNKNYEEFAVADVILPCEGFEGDTRSNAIEWDECNRTGWILIAVLKYY